MQLQITANMHCVQVNVLKVCLNGEGWVRAIHPDSRILKNPIKRNKDNDIWLMLKGEHYDTLVKEDNPIVEGEKVTEWLEKVPEVWKQ